MPFHCRLWLINLFISNLINFIVIVIVCCWCRAIATQYTLLWHSCVILIRKCAYFAYEYHIRNDDRAGAHGKKYVWMHTHSRVNEWVHRMLCRAHGLATGHNNNLFATTSKPVMAYIGTCCFDHTRCRMPRIGQCIRFHCWTSQRCWCWCRLPIRYFIVNFSFTTAQNRKNNIQFVTPINWPIKWNRRTECRKLQYKNVIISNRVANNRVK